MSEPRFIHLHVRSDYSVIDGLSKTVTLVNKAKELNMSALAITDFTNLFGLIKFYCTAHSYGIKPIIGADFLVKNEMFSKELTKLTILAANNVGYHNLILLISKAYKSGYSNVGPTIDRNWLVPHHEGLILLSGACEGDIGSLLIKRNLYKVEKCLEFYEQHFSEHYYLELIRTGRPNEETYLQAVIELALKKELPVVATNDVRFISSDDFDAHDIRVAIHDGLTLHDPKRSQHKYSAQQYMRSEQEMCTLFSDLPEALANSVEIARRCNVTIRLGEYFLPKFPTGSLSTEHYLVKCAREGLEERLAIIFPDTDTRYEKRSCYDQRLTTELYVINQMGFPGYFLIVMEFIQWAKDHGIPVGPGRGSGAGSLVAYALKITDLNPIEFNLLFERFLNPERVSMPDFDIDFCMEKRDLVIEHVIETYGYNAVSQIITFGTMTAKSVIRDVGRVLGHPYGFADHISKLIPTDPGMTLEKALYIEPQLQVMYDTNEEIKILIDMARKLEGIIRNASTHAGGVVISPTKITDFAPLYCDHEGNHPVTQFDKNDVEYAGLVKFDFLGLRTLTIIDRALKMINVKRIQNNLSVIDIDNIPLNDKKSFNMLQRAETTAVFQLESRGMKELMMRLQPDCFEDIIALVALFRPGPLKSGMVDNFINRKHGREVISYPDLQWQHKSLQQVLASTYGIILYQEQVMQIAQVLAGYTLGEADILRRAMSKKKPEEMAKQRSIFKKGAGKAGVDGKLSMKIFDLVEKFAGYGFNKSHSAAYALVSYQTLWLKVHYPAEFMAAVMTADMDNTEKIANLVGECFRMGLKVLPPDINNGQYYFHVNEKNEILYGMGAIKGVGESSIKAIIEARNEYGLFRNLFDLCTRIDIKKLNRRVLEKLIMSGALDCLGMHRASLMHAISNALQAANQITRAEDIGQSDMFGVLADRSNTVNSFCKNIVPFWSEKERLENERETIGFYLTGHPIDQYTQEIKYYTGVTCLKDLDISKRGKMINAAGIVVSIRKMITKRGKYIGLCTLNDRSGQLDMMLFSDTLKKYQYLLEKNRILIARGQVSVDDFNSGVKIIVQELMDINEARNKYVCRLAISLTEQQRIDEEFLISLRLSLETHQSGTIPVHLYWTRKKIRVPLQYKEAWFVKLSDRLLNELRTLMGNDEQVVLEFS